MNWKIVKQLAIGLLALLVVVIPAFAFAQGGGLVPCGEGGNQCEFNDLIVLVNNIINFLIKSIALPVSALLFAWAGFLYLTATEDEKQVQKAHGIFMNVFVGLVVTLAAWLIINLVTTILTGKAVGSFFG